MNTKKHIRNLLLVFAVGSVAYMFVRELSDRRAVSHTATATAAEVTPATKLIVYYFSEGKECTTCEQIPFYTKTALDTHFTGELKLGEIVWCMIDVDEARNRHYIDEYNIYTKSIVLSRIADGKQTRWKNLDRVWDLVYDRSGFVEYIQKEVRAELDTAA